MTNSEIFVQVQVQQFADYPLGLANLWINGERGHVLSECCDRGSTDPAVGPARTAAVAMILIEHYGEKQMKEFLTAMLRRN